MKSIRVWVFRRDGRKFYQAQWIDPITGKRVTRSTGLDRRSEAIRFAAKLEADLQSGRYESGDRVTWSHFRSRYESEALPGLAPSSAKKQRCALNAVEQIICPQYVDVLDASQISLLAAGIRKRGNAEASIKSMLASVRSSLTWAQDVGLLKTVPKFRMPERVRGMKGRAPTTEEFERIKSNKNLSTVLQRTDGWAELLDGLWWSGLRLGEAMALHWTDDRELCIDLSGKYPMFRIQAYAEKGRKFRLLPIAPEFGQWLLSVPAERRHGFVFNPKPRRGDIRLLTQYVGKVICALGKAANVKVKEVRQGNRTVTKYASAQDFRRAFGFRWATRVSPMILQEMMRHESIQTTQEFYVGSLAEAAAAQIWASAPSATLSATEAHTPTENVKTT